MHVIRTAALAAVAALTLTSCAQVQEATNSATSAAVAKAREAEQAAIDAAMDKMNDPDTRWMVGCTATDLGLKANSLDRERQMKTLQAVADATVSDPTQHQWATNAIGLLRLKDPTQAPQSVKDAVGGPCRDHGHTIPSLA